MKANAHLRTHWCHSGTLFPVLAAIVPARGAVRAYPSASRRECAVFGTVRIGVAAALGALLLLSLWAANGRMDAVFAPGQIAWDRANPMSRTGIDVLARLNGMKAEIRADICSRDETRYCMGGMCMPLPRKCEK